MSSELDIDRELEEKDGSEEEQKKGDMKGKIIALASVVAVIGICVVFGVLLNNSHYLSTDNAKVTSDIYSLVPKADGKLVKFDAYVGKYVKSGEIIGRVEGGPYIKAPANGEIIQVDAEKGEYVSASDVVGIISSVDHIYIGANIEEGDITKVQKGQEVKVKLDAYGSRSFDGVVTKVNNITENAIAGNMTSFSTSGTYTKTTQLIPVEISLVNSDIQLSSIIGTNADVKIRIR